MQPKSTVHVLCPNCRASVGSIGDVNKSCTCGYEVVEIASVPVLWMAGREMPFDLTAEAKTLPTMDSANLNIPAVREAIATGGLVLELGAGVDMCEAPNLTKTDAFVYADNLDVCADAHNLPFEDNTFDFVFSLAVFEHLHSPWIAAKEIHRVVRPGGKVYTLCAFNQHVHGYPHHYFNMTDQGLKRIFEDFKDVTVTPSPYCPLDQIAYSLFDLDSMNSAYASRNPNKLSQSLSQGISQIASVIGELGPKLMACDDARPHFARIAPGFDCYATKA